MLAHELFEGLIKVPPRLLSGMEDALRREVLWRVRDRFTKQERAAFPGHWAEVKALLKKYGITLPREKAETPKGFIVKGFKLAPDDVPDGYPAAEPNEGLFLILNFEDTIPALQDSVAMGVWWASKNAIALNLCKDRGLSRFPSKSEEPGFLEFSLDQFCEVLTHELRHAIQTKLLSDKDPRQVEKEPDYDQHGPGYYASQIELDPQIGSGVHEFLNFYRTCVESGKPVDLAKSFKTYVGALPSRGWDIFGRSDFFKGLKRRSPEKWRIAVRKFYVELHKALQDEAGKSRAVPKKARKAA